MSVLKGSSETVYRLPKKYWHCHFHSFDWEEKEVLKGHLEKFGKKVLEGEKPPPHLILYGNPGRGKSHLGVAFYRWYIYHNHASSAVWLNVPEFCDRVKSSFDSKEDVWSDIEEAEFLVLDDILARELSPWELDNVIFRLINSSYNEEQYLVITDNNNIEGLSKYLKKHEMSRILENSTVLNFNNLPDWRIT